MLWLTLVVPIASLLQVSTTALHADQYRSALPHLQTLRNISQTLLQAPTTTPLGLDLKKAAAGLIAALLRAYSRQLLDELLEDETPVVAIVLGAKMRLGKQRVACGEGEPGGDLAENPVTCLLYWAEKQPVRSGLSACLT